MNSNVALLALCRPIYALAIEPGQAVGCRPAFSKIKSMISASPRPCFRLVMTNGRPLRIRVASRCITSSEAPTWGARSALLITRISDRVMAGPPLRGISSPAATSIT